LSDAENATPLSGLYVNEAEAIFSNKKILAKTIGTILSFILYSH
jgi:hypothetical protein